ncbi:MAG: LegC family aminotransferase [Candidatus Omnitrophica bacterium]|nr:LegC family aminotransferase [Candidatus Omnitrophota bacterium]
MRKIPLSVLNIGAEEKRSVLECLDSGWIAAGKFITELEKRLCRYLGAKKAVCCVNGTCGLLVSLDACGVKADEEVIVPCLTFISPVNAVSYLGAKPVFMDCDEYMNIDVNKFEDFLRLECRMTERGPVNKCTKRLLKAVIPVHVFGNPCDMKSLMEVARRYRLKVIEDATESLGSYYTVGNYKGKFTSTIGDLGVLSFNANKIITSGGGGAVISNNDNLAKRVRYLINQAKDDPLRYIHNRIGYNFRFNNIQAAIACAQVDKLERFIAAKKKNYGLYASGIKGIEGLSLLGVPQGTRPNYWFYSLIVDEKCYGLSRDGLMRKLADNKIESRPLWQLNHLQQPYRLYQSYRIERAPGFLKRILNIPSSSGLKEKEVERVIKVLKKRR